MSRKLNRIALLSVLMVLLSIFHSADSAQALTFTTSYPTISSGSTVGVTLTAYPNTWTPTPDSFSYQWKRNGTAITGATSSTYVVTGADWGYYISVAVTGTKTGYTSVTQDMYSYTSGNYISISGSLTNTASVTGTFRVGEYVYAEIGSLPAGVTASYTWYSGGYSIYGATGSSYQLQPSDQGYQVKVSVYLTGYGWSSRTSTSASSVTVLAALPRASITAPYYTLTGKNIIEIQGYTAYKSTNALTNWCFYLDGKSLPVNTLGTSGVSFLNSSGTVLSSRKVSDSCYSPIGTAVSAKVSVDVTAWSVGSHNISATVQDSGYYISDTAVNSVSVGKTAPTVRVDYFQPAVSKLFTINVSTTTHSTTAPVRIFCAFVDGQSAKITKLVAKAGGNVSASSIISSGEFNGCAQADSAVNVNNAEVTINSEQFKNGDHTLEMRVISDDGLSKWSSDVASSKIMVKNEYVPTVVFSTDATKATMIGKYANITGVIQANIPELPGNVVVSFQNADGGWEQIEALSGVSTFKVPFKLTADTIFQVEVFDQNKVSKYVGTKEILASPSFTVSKPIVVLTGSTLSKSKSKSVTYKVTGGNPIGASCSLRWTAGGKSGNKSFKLSKATSVSFNPPNTSGKATIVCLTENMTSKLPGFFGNF